MEYLRETIYETENFFVEVNKDLAYVSRQDGGHLRIKMKDPVSDRTKLTPRMAVEYMRLSILVGSAFEQAMNNRGIPVVKINYQDMGNWAWKNKPVEPKLHMHIFGRSKNAIKQVFPEAVQLPTIESGFYDDNEPLNDEDINELKRCIEKEEKKDKYNPELWSLV